ncbi:ATP-binding protein [Streptomyces tubercidicus]|uniref:ATP-binding protein n=1 Tax=Streptomyces tubercidicus TaxID=47759 RepID=UPI003467ADEF
MDTTGRTADDEGPVDHFHPNAHLRAVPDTSDAAPLPEDKPHTTPRDRAPEIPEGPVRQAAQAFAAELIRLRTAAGLSQLVLARSMGYTKSYVTHVERCTQAPTQPFARRADQILGSAEALTRLWHAYHTVHVADRRRPRGPLPAPSAVDTTSQMVHAATRAQESFQAGSPPDNRNFQAIQPSYRVTPRLLPPPVKHFTGRSAELSALDRLLATATQSEGPRTVLLSGPPGVGKTALAIEWANRAIDSFDGGQLYADLRGFDLARPVRTEEVFDSFLRALGIPPTDLPGFLGAQESLFRNLIAQRKILVILDNVESAENVRPFLVGTTGAVLATSRNRLPGLAARDGAQAMVLDMLNNADSLTLLRKTVGPQIVDAAPEAASRLAEFCGRLPLALRIAGQQIATRPHLALDRHADALMEEIDVLDALLLDDDERTILTSVFSWSYRKLDQPTARLFRLLGLAPGRSLGTTAVSMLCGINSRSVRKMLRTLVNTHLVEELPGEHFSLHDLLRAYACSLAGNEEIVNEENSEIRQLIHWYAASVDNADQFLTPGRVERDDVNEISPTGETFTSFDEALSWLDQERPNLVDILRRAMEIGEHHLAAIIPNLLWGYFNLTKHWSDWIECNTLGLAAARLAGDTKSEAYLTMSQGVVFRNLRQVPDAVSHHRSAVLLFEQLDDRLGLAYALQNLANAESADNSIESALAHFGRALEIFQTVPDGRRGRAVTLNSKAIALNSFSRHEEVLEAAEEAKTIMHVMGDSQGEAIALLSLGLAFSKLHRNEEALESYREALSLQSTINDRYGEAQVLLALGQLYAGERRWHEAQVHLQDALQIFEDLQAPERTRAAAELEKLLEDQQGASSS